LLDTGDHSTIRAGSLVWRAAVGKLTARALVPNGEVAIYDQQLRSR